MVGGIWSDDGSEWCLFEIGLFGVVIFYCSDSMWGDGGYEIDS